MTILLIGYGDFVCAYRTTNNILKWKSGKKNDTLITSTDLTSQDFVFWEIQFKLRGIVVINSSFITLFRIFDHENLRLIQSQPVRNSETKEVANEIFWLCTFYFPIHLPNDEDFEECLKHS